MTHFAPTWATSAPIVTHAIQKWVAVNENRHGYHCAMLATPEKTMKMLPATSGNSPTRSTRWAIPLTAGQATNRGQMTHSLAIRTGTDAIPAATWIPCVSR